MSNSYRIRTQVGVDKSIKVLIDQEFEYLEILSLKVLQSQIYTRQCSDYGVVIGRVTANDGFGIPNAKVSIFIPLTDEDSANPIISDLYPYKTLSELNEDGYRYNLLPYVKSYSNHTPTGTFFSKNDVLVDPTLIEVYDKYFKYTAKTNDSGDYMIFGVPTGSQTIHVDVDLSDIGEFSLSPQDLVRMGVATEAQVAGTKFKASNNLNELPQIVSINRVVEVEPLWGQPEICNLGITRTDFDLTDEANITITPTSIFMGSIFSSNDDQFQKRNCKPKLKQGKLCNLVTGPGEILAIRQTIQQDLAGQPILETVDLESGGQVIDENGTWLVDVPMNLDYVITNEFGERVFSNDPKKGIPTKGKYRFKVKWNQSPTLSEPVKRGYFLVPNVREYGWSNSNTDPLKESPSSADYQEALKSYSFSLDWNDYADPQSAINCEDTFYEMKYNKVYTVSQLIDQYRRGYLPNRMITVKDILDESCESENVKFPTNDSVIRFDIIYLLFVMMMFIFKPILYILLIVVHVLAFFLMLIGPVLAIIVGVVMELVFVICEFINGLIWAINLIPGVNINGLDCPSQEDIKNTVTKMLTLYKLFTKLAIPNLSYPDCELCSCKDGEAIPDTTTTNTDTSGLYSGLANTGINSILSQYQTGTNYNIGGATYPGNFQAIIAGGNIDATTPTATSRAPQMTTYGTDGGGDRHLFTSSLTLAERINLFNTKAKYFDDFAGNNPGGGYNRIKVTFNTDLNGTSFTKYHYDNVVVMSCQSNQLTNFQSGQIVTFQDPTLSKDVNLTGYTLYNQFGTQSITGTSINDTGTIQISYANPNGSGTIAPPNSLYTISQDPADAEYAKFAMDIEYFQVITAMTYSNFSGMSNPVGSDLSLNKRYLYNDMKFQYMDSDNCVAQTTPSVISFNPLASFYSANSQVIVILVRGVDPYSTRQNNKYDLSVLFGNPWGTNTVTGSFKLNHPIQGSFKSVKHNMTGNVMGVDMTTSEYLYYESFHFKPESNPTNAGFSGFSSNLPTYYSSLDSLTFGWGPTGTPTMSNVCDNGVYGAASIKAFAGNPILGVSKNGFVINWTAVPSLGCGAHDLSYNWSVNSYPSDNDGYFEKEIVEGGSVMLQQLKVGPYGSGLINISQYYAPRYNSTTNYSYSTLGSNGCQIIMRSDRLPLSTSVQETAGNSFALQNNTLFSAFAISDDGSVSNTAGTQSGSPSLAENGETQEEQLSGISTNVLSTFSCGQMVPLKCYYEDSTGSGACVTGEISVQPSSDNCYENGVTGDKIMENGCYILITAIFLSLPKDFQLLTEWTSRIQITFGACRDVWSHIFTNNWINGALYAFSFKNDRFFTPPTATPPNAPYSEYCKDTLILHPTNNFYYRSSPWDGVGFIGAESPNGFFGPQGGNSKNLKFPTTIMDLGPRSQYLQEIVMSDDYDGYVVNKLNPTTFTDVSEILNLLIISRLINTSFLAQLFGVGGGNILSYFDKRSKRFVDADYAQMISISSELGIADFEPANYPPIAGGQDPVYFNGSSVSDGVIGIFFSSDTQVRDYITPKRTIVDDTAMVTDTCAFNYFSVFTQDVPFYQWEVKANSDMDSIFGSQSNDWFTDPISNNYFFSHKYQEMDRININSRYFRGDSTVIKDYKGYIYSMDSSGNYQPCITPTNPNSNNPDPRTITVGAPFHFYFGLKKGKTAFDRFATKWIPFQTITD
jgi:hypothetical protein